jgi:hypothetical protein
MDDIESAPIRAPSERGRESNSGAAPFSSSVALWSLASFRTTSFVVVAILWLHHNGSLSGSLQRLNTLTGFGLFGALWATTWLASRSALRRMGTASTSPGAAAMITTVAGAWNGVYLFGVLVAGFLVISIGARGPGAVTVVPVLVFGTAFGGALAFTIGAIVGLVYGVCEAFIRAVSDRLPT